MNSKFSEMLKKANSGDTVAMMELGAAYLGGDVTGEANLSEGLKWCEKAAEKGDGTMKYLYGNMLKTVGLENEAFKWFFKSANENCKKGQAMLALCYHTSFGTGTDDKKALHWATKAFNNGERETSTLVLANLYIQGNVVEQNPVAAFRLFKMSAENGNEDARQTVKKLEAQFPQLKNL